MHLPLVETLRVVVVEGVEDLAVVLVFLLLFWQQQVLRLALGRVPLLQPLDVLVSKHQTPLRESASAVLHNLIIRINKHIV